MNLNYYFNEALNTIEVKEIDNISIDHLIKIYEMVENNQDFPRRLNVLIDARSTKINFTIRDVSKIKPALNKVLPHYEMYREAILLSSPFETAVVTFFSAISQKSNYQLKVFSTKEAALAWLSN